MMTKLTCLISAFLLIVASGCGRRNESDGGTADGQENAASFLLSDDQRNALLVESPSDSSGKKLVFQSSFAQIFPENKADVEFYRTSGRIPYRIMAMLSETKTVRGSELSRMLSGTARLYILDSESNVVAKASVSLDKMCPS